MQQVRLKMWLKLLLELMQVIIPIEGAVTAAVQEAHSNDPTGTKVVNIAALAQRIVNAAAPLVATITEK